MKYSLRFLGLVLLLFTQIVVISCDSNEDDEIKPDAVIDTVDMDDSEDDDSTDTDSSDNNSSDTNSTEKGAITRYKVDGVNLVKVEDYEVTGDKLLLQNDVEKHQEIWSLVKKIIPLNYLSKMSDFIIFSGVEADDTLGYVIETKEDLSEWKMGIAIDLAYDGGFNANGELAFTIVHEFGHIVSLDNTQLNSAIAESDCTNFFAGEGCANEDAYLNKLYQLGWADIWAEYLESEENVADADPQAFYNTYSTRFISDYAATNPGEDIAETFATFVTRNGGVNGSSIAEQKIQIMYDHAEIIALRDFARSNDISAKTARFLPEAGAIVKVKCSRSLRK